MRIRMIVIAALAALSMSVIGCGDKKGGGSTTTPPPSGGEEASLYTRLGGKEAITAVVNEFVGIVVADDRINAFFKNADAENLKKQLVDQICDAASGGKECQYKGKDMKTVHTGMNIEGKHFDALVEDLVKALDKLGVKQKEKDELLSVLGPMKKDIVTK
jgi:hemoglobin